jgi:CubicO group peptidase (beta-lactamase class C family)
MAFTYFNRNIPDEAHQQIAAMGPAGVRVFAFAPGGGWVIVTENGHYARGIPDECFTQIGQLRAAGHKINVIAFPPEGGNRFLIVTDRTYFARNIPDECFDRLGTMWAAGARPTCVAFPAPGGNRWAILAGKSLYCRNIDDECYQLLWNYAQGLLPAQRVAFTPSGGWVILAQDRYFARRIPDECYTQMGILGANFWIDHVNFEFGDGWSIISNTPRSNVPNDPLRQFEGQVLQSGGQWQSITQRMANWKVPGVSVAVVQNNQVAWTTSYGRVEAGADTAFQAASCSKPVSTMGFLQLVQDNLIGLDEDVNPKLGWALPRRTCAPAAWAAKVNLRRLLQHNGGIIGRGATNPTNTCSNFDAGGGGGFGGYANVSGVGVPNVTEVLNGTSNRPGVNVNSHRIELTYDPGSINGGAYSGEGFVLMMQLLQNLRGLSFGDWMQSHVLAPARMTQSTFSQAAPSNSGPPASGHWNTGSAIPGKRNRYPEAPAAGLYTTAADLCRYVIAVNQGGVVGGQTIIDNTRYTAMMSNSLGMPTGNIGTDSEWFWHNGQNAGFSCEFKGYPKKKAGFAVLTNGDDGTLHGEIAAALIRTYGWE